MKKAEQLFEQYLKQKGMPQGKDEIVELIEWVLDPKPTNGLRYDEGQVVEVVFDPDGKYEEGDKVEVIEIDYDDRELTYGVKGRKCNHLWWFAEENLKPIS